MLMTHDKRASRDAKTDASAAESLGTGGTLPHLARSDGLQFGLPGLQPRLFNQTQAGAGTTASALDVTEWNDRQRVQDFFRHTASSGTHRSEPERHKKDTRSRRRAEEEDHAIDIRKLVSGNAVSERRDSFATSSTSSDDNQPDEMRSAVTDRGRLQSALEDLLAKQEAESEQSDDEPLETKKDRRRYDSFDIMADVRLDDEGSYSQLDDVDSVYSTPARSRANSEDFFGGGLLEMLSKRHMPAGIDRHASVADMLANRVIRTPNTSSDDEAQASPRSKGQQSSRKVTEAREAPPKPATTDTSNVLVEMLSKRAAPSPDSASSPKVVANKNNALEAMLTKRSSPTPPSPDMEPKTPKTNPLEAMLASRNAPAESPVATPDKRNESPAASDVVPPADEKNSVTKDDTPLKNHPVYQKYFKMLAVGLPPPVVKHKMQSENVDPAILDMDPNKPLPDAPVPALDDEAEATYQAQLKEYEAKHGKYLQMVKVGLPTAVVEHKMRMEGVDPSWLQGPPKRPEPKAAPVLEVTAEERAAHRKKYHKYFQMLRMGLPRGAVEQKMRMAGLDPAELNGPRPVPATPEQPTKSLKRQNSVRKKLHWEGKKHGTRRDSLWGCNAVEEAKEHVQISEESRAMLEKLFVKDLSESKKRNASAKSDDAAAAAKKKKALVQLIDMKKSQNIAITLARVKLPFPELKRELLAMNASVLSTAQLCSLIDMWPDRKEMEAVTAFDGDVASIGTAEQFLVEVRHVPRFQEKLACLVFKQEFPTRVHELRESVDLVTRGVYQVCSSAELRQLFIYILQIGNLLNFGGDDDQQGVVAFSLGSLVKFSQTKAFVGGITFLQYVVQSIERDVPHLALFYKDINLISKCSKVAYASLASEKHALEAGLQKLLNEAEASIPDGTASEEDKEAMKAYNATLMHFCKDVKTELHALQDLLDKLDAAKAHFLNYFEEEDTEEELDVLLSHIANFTSEYRREYKKYRANMKKETTKASSKGSPGIASTNAVGPKQGPKLAPSKVQHGGKVVEGTHGHHSHDKAAAHPHRTAMPPQIDHPQPARSFQNARALHLESPNDHLSSSHLAIPPKTS
ncbi:hypothetical protein PsorP6_017039 [Peronosclerospora sorghi]|uniref:Uncharacterized protein n=1 Tax=Peronosclerospora sorghi TaxID=230839 RepID=A0ACC0WF46_9STRA|nr:hypothetical protein PsorP6_017039 [Peronosclerospora sorghi]